LLAAERIRVWDLRGSEGRGSVTMKSLEELIEELPPDLKQEVQDFAEFLAERRKPPKQKFMRLS